MSGLLLLVAFVLLALAAPRFIGCLATIIMAVSAFLAVLGYYLLGGFSGGLGLTGAVIIGLVVMLVVGSLGYNWLVRR